MRVGTLQSIWRYPVKSMAGESLDGAEVGWHGLAGDRRWAFVRGDVPRSGFPWLTQRQNADMRRYVPAFEDPADPDASSTRVTTPDGERYDVADPALAALLADGARAIKLDVGTFDSMPLSLITTATIAGLSALTDRALEPERFRPNLLVEPAEPTPTPFPEDAWVGRTLRIGETAMRVDRRDPRCVIVTIDPAGGERDPHVLRQIARERERCAGVYGTVVARGRVSVGDAVVLED